jgi:5'-nucleotidase
MSLKVLGKWKYFGPSMEFKFSSMQSELSQTHTFHEASPTSPTSNTSLPHHPRVARVKNQHTRTASPDSEADPDTDEEDHNDGGGGGEDGLIKFSERETQVVRRVMRKWWRLAGLQGAPRCADSLEGEEMRVDWTKAVAPRVEGRIKDVTPGGGGKA